MIININNSKSENSFPNKYTLAKDDDFEWREDYFCDGVWHYVGKDIRVAIPHTIQGKKVTSYKDMFSDTYVSDVYSDNPNITDMSFMFYNSKAAELDLSNFNTSGVTDMAYMFYECKATSLNLSNFDTSKVTGMGHMFSYSKATSLDLSSFDTKNVTRMVNMFYGSEIKIGYARTQEDANKFLYNSKYRPKVLTFKIKS